MQWPLCEPGGLKRVKTDLREVEEFLGADFDQFRTSFLSRHLVHTLFLVY